MDNSVSGDKKDIVKLAHMFFHNGQWDKALVEYKKILATDPDDMNTHKTLGDIYLKKNLIQYAYESYSKAASGFLSHGQTDKAFLVYKKIIMLSTSKLSDDARSQISFIQVYVKIDQELKDGKIETAIEMLGKILKFRPDDPMVRALLMELDNKIALIPVSIQQYQTLGNAFLKNNMFEKAQNIFEKVKTIDPQNQAIRLHLAQLYLKQGAQSEAKKEYLNLAEEAFAKDDLDQAFEFAQKAIALKSVEAHYVSGLIYFKGQKWSEAITEFEKLLRIKINHVGALLHLGKSFDVLGRLEKATETFHKALKLDKDNPQIQEAWIEFCVRSKDKETAIPNLTTLLDKTVTVNNADQIVKFSKLMIRLEPNLVFPHIKLIEALQILGDLYGAADAFCALASIYEKQNQFNDATQCLEKALVLTPANAEVLEKALEWMRQKELRVKSFPTLKSNMEKSAVPESSDSDAIFRSVKIETVEVLVEPPAQTPSQAVYSNTLENQMAMANMCVQQGFLKAAIEIYQQLLEMNPGLVEVRKKLIEINGIYMKKFMES